MKQSIYSINMSMYQTKKNIQLKIFRFLKYMIVIPR